MVELVRQKRKAILFLALAAMVVGSWFVATNYLEIGFYFQHLPGIRRFFKSNVAADVAAKYSAAVHARLAPAFSAAGVTYPPRQLAYVALKAKRQLLVYAAGDDEVFKFICAYPILGASGHLGPKLKEGDYQVPEGVYKLTLEPNTPYHVALRLNYPNEIDLARAKADGRANPGSDILIHGTNGSVGCIAMGDQVSEDLYVIAFDTGKTSWPLVVAPVDLRSEVAPPANADDPVWLPQLYEEIKAELAKYPAAH